METFKRTPLQLFNLPQHFVIPLFQRAYVWKEEEQWEPLWNDIRRVVELRLAEPYSNARHFLGAVVLQAHEAQTQRFTTWNVIDGQQRLTTLQLLADAAQAVFTAAGVDRLAGQLEDLTHNSERYVEGGESRLKVRHLNNDRDAFDEVMTAEPPVDHGELKHSDSLIVQAHAYFTSVVQQWLGPDDGTDFEAKAKELTNVLLDGVQLVSIELEASENSQEIFETLNARGTPLTAADLVRNLVFQRMETEGGDTKRAYKEDWPFETKFWTKEVSVGRYLVSRSSLFINQWLVARTGEEIGPQATFSRFKSYVEHETGQKMAELLPLLKRQAQQYEVWTEAAAQRSGDLGVVEMAVYRMNASGLELLKPLLIWLNEPERNVPQPVIDEAVAAAESWVVRRQLLRLSGSSLGRVVADIIKTHASAPPDELADRVRAHLARLNSTSTYWPGDEEIRHALMIEAAYRRYPRARLRSFLEAVENNQRAKTKQPQVERVGFPIEHVLPQQWRDSWPVEGAEAEAKRQERVHLLGNLTLLTGSLNSKVSNGPWSEKRRALLAHNTMKLTGQIVEMTETRPWDEGLIDQRTADMVTTLLKIWPVPSGHRGNVVDPQAKAQDWVEVKHLIEGCLLSAGDRLVGARRGFDGAAVTVGVDGGLEADGRRFRSPSAAAQHFSKQPTNGWNFWALPDGRRLRDLRSEFLGADRAPDGF